jgi:hypothetical protein
MGVAEFHETGAFGIFDHVAFQRHGAHFIEFSAAWPHRASSFFANAGHHNHMQGLNKLEQDRAGGHCNRR